MAWRETIKKPVAKPTAPKPKFEKNDDDWETDLSYQNEATEKSQRYGSASVPGTGRIDHVDFKAIQEKVKTADSKVTHTYQEKNPNRGYGGKFGTDRVMDKSAVDFTYQPQIEKHSSQTDFKKGFGGEYGVDERAKDKSALGYDYQAPVEKHSSQTDFSKGFGGKFGVDSHAQDKSAVGFSHQESLSKHSSQKDYSVGFGGKYGIQKEEPSKLPVRSSPPSDQNVMEKPLPPLGSSAGVGNIRAKFENIKKQQEEEVANRVAEERKKRTVIDQEARQNQPEPRTIPVSVPQPVFVSPPAPTPAPPRDPVDTIYENIPEQSSSPWQQKQQSSQPSNGETKADGVDVSSLLRNRQISSSSASSNKHDNDDEWAEDYNINNYQTSVDHYESVQNTSNYAENSSNNNYNEGIRCIARYSYQKTEEDELGFEENEIITNVQKNHEEWWYGKIGPRFGLFPANYVEELQ